MGHRFFVCLFSFFLLLSVDSLATERCRDALREVAHAKSAIYFHKLDPRFYRLRRQIQSGVEERLPAWRDADREELTRVVYEVLRQYEAQRWSLPPKAYVFWTASKITPLAVGALIAWLVPRDYQAVTAIAATFTTQQLLDPLAAAVQEKWNGRMRERSSSQASVFRGKQKDPINTELNNTNDSATGVQSSWEDVGDGKFRAIEPNLRASMSDARAAYKDGDTETALEFAGDCVVDYLTRWRYLAVHSRILGAKMQHLFKPFDRDFRERLEKEVLSRDIFREQGVSEVKLHDLLDYWMPLSAEPRPAE